MKNGIRSFVCKIVAYCRNANINHNMQPLGCIDHPSQIRAAYCGLLCCHTLLRFVSTNILPSSWRFKQKIESVCSFRSFVTHVESHTLP